MSYPIEKQKLWLSNFENLCPYLKFNIDKPVLELKKWLENPSRDRGEHGYIWEKEKEFFDYPDLAERINFYWEKIMWQPIWYLIAIEQVPKLITDEDINERFDLIYLNIELSIDKLNQCYFSKIADQLSEKIRINKTGADQLFFEIMLNFTNQLETIGDINSVYHFNFKESPLFISLYEFINKIKKRYAMINANASFQIFDEYIETLPELKKKFDLWNLKHETENAGNQLTGFTCTLNLNTVKKIFDLLVNHKPKPQIEGKLEDFQTIFSNTQTPVKSPVKWLILHNRKPNKTALFTFIKMMLELDEVPRDILRQANHLFIYGKENIFPETPTYPSKKEQINSSKAHFKQVPQIIFLEKTRPA